MSSVCIIGATLPAIALANQLSSDNFSVSIYEAGDNRPSIDSHHSISSLTIDGELKTTTLNQGLGGTSELWTGGLVRSLDDSRSNINPNLLSNLSPLREAFIALKDDLNQTPYCSRAQLTFVLDRPLRGSSIPLESSILLLLNTRVLSISRTSCNRWAIQSVTCGQTSLHYYDVCVIAAGTLGTIELLKKGPLANLPNILDLLTHPKFNAGSITLKKPPHISKIMGNYRFYSTGYTYSRFLLSIYNSDCNSTCEHGLRLSTRRSRFYLKIFKVLPNFWHFRSLYTAILPIIDSIICTLWRLLRLHETVDITVFLDDSSVPSSISTSDLKINISTPHKYLLAISHSLDLFAKIHFGSAYIADHFQCKDLTLLHSHLCSSLWASRKQIESLEHQNLYVISSACLPAGYYNPMYELLSKSVQVYTAICQN